MTKWALLIALLAATGCSETETEIVVDSGDDDQVALGITTNLKVEAGMKSATKSVATGSLITYAADDYTDDDLVPGLGIVITNKSGNAWYTPDGTTYTGHHVWYMGDEKGANWKSIKTKGADFAATAEEPYYLTKEVGQVYAYYPYSTSSAPASYSDLKIGVSILPSGTIDAKTNNAKKYWYNNSWASNKTNLGVNLSQKTEKDYLYFAATGGRYVNNGRADGQAPVKPEADPDNNNQDNPGYKINLDMKHAMSMVSFRVYDGGKLSTKDVNFKRFRVKNADSGSKPFKMGTGYMALTDGTITPNSQSYGDISRDVENYILMRQVETGEQQSDKAFIANGSTVNAMQVCKAVSAMVYPTTFQDNEIEVDITLQEGSNQAVVYTVSLPANTWDANSNYIYTFSAGRNKLTVMDVSVEEWNEVDEDEIPL